MLGKEALRLDDEVNELPVVRHGHVGHQGPSRHHVLSTPQKAIAHTSRKLDLTSSGPKTDLPSGPWFALNATLPLSPVPLANLLPNRNSPVFAKLLLLPDQDNEVAPWLQPEIAPPVLVTQQLVQEVKSLHPADPDLVVPAQTSVSNLFLAQGADLIPNTPTNAKTQRTWSPRHAC